MAHKPKSDQGKCAGTGTSWNKPLDNGDRRVQYTDKRWLCTVAKVLQKELHQLQKLLPVHVSIPPHKPTGITQH